MAKAAAKKRIDVENELMTHVDNISDPKVREFIKNKKAAKLAALRERQERSGPKKEGVWKKDAKMVSESESEEEVVAKPILAKIKAKTNKTAETAVPKLAKKSIKK